MAFCQREAATIRPDGPWVTGAVIDNIQDALIVIAEGDLLAFVREATAKWAINGGEAGARSEDCRVIRYDNIGFAGDDGVRRKNVADAAELPPGDIHIDRHLVMKFDPFDGIAVARVVHDFVENDNAVRSESAQDDGKPNEAEVQSRFQKLIAVRARQFTGSLCRRM